MNQQNTKKSQNSIKSKKSKPRVENEFCAKRTILREAAILFAEKGFDGVSTRDIAKASGLNISLISYYFKGKEGLYCAVLEEFALHAQCANKTILRPFENFPQTQIEFEFKMREFLESVLRFKMDFLSTTIILQREVLEGLRFSRHLHESVFKEILEATLQVFYHSQKFGFISDKINPAFLFQSLLQSIDSYLISKYHQSSISKYLPSFEEDKNEIVEDLMIIYVKGVNVK